MIIPQKSNLLANISFSPEYEGNDSTLLPWIINYKKNKNEKLTKIDIIQLTDKHERQWI